MISVSFRHDTPIAAAGLTMVQSEVRALREHLTALTHIYPTNPAESCRVGETFQVGSLQIESHQVGEFSPTGEAGGWSDRTSRSLSTRPRISPVQGKSRTAIIVPQMPDGRYGLVMRYRFAPAKWSLEFPSGLIEELNGDGEDTWRDSCARVLGEATGWIARDMSLLGSVQVDPSCMSTQAIVTWAQFCTRQRIVSWDPQSMIAGCVAASPAALDQLIRRGEVECSATLSALFLARLRLADAACAAPECHVHCSA